MRSPSAPTVGFSDRIFLGKTRWLDDFCPRFVGVKSDAHLCTFGCTGSGKSTTAIWTALALYGGPVFGIDPKGEHSRVLSRRRAELGPVYRCDAFNVTRLGSHCCNPLAAVDVTTTAGMELLREQVAAIVIQESTATAGIHFSESAITAILGVATFVCSTFPPVLRTWPTVLDCFNSINPLTGSYDPEVWDKLVQEMAANPAGGGAAIMAAKMFLDVGGDEGGSFKSTVARQLKWLANDAMRAHLSGNDFCFSELATQGPEKPTILVAFGVGQEQHFSRYIRLLTATAIWHLRNAFRQTGDKPNPPALMVLDEFALYGKNLDCATSGFATLREVACCLWIQTQKISQLIDCVGKEKASLLLQSSTVQGFGFNNDADDTAKWFSDRLGQQGVSEKAAGAMLAGVPHGRPVLTQSEILEAFGQHSPNQLVCPVNGRPMWLHRCSHRPIIRDGRQLFETLPPPIPDLFDQPRGY